MLLLNGSGGELFAMNGYEGRLFDGGFLGPNLLNSCLQKTDRRHCQLTRGETLNAFVGGLMAA